jgi:hypothetical protein
MRYLIIALFLLLGGSQAWGATVALRAYDDDPGGVRLFTIRVEDRLAPGDLGQIKREFRKARQRGVTVMALELGSWGGDADTGMAIARYVHDNRLRVMVNGVCSSACAYAALVALGNGHMAVMSTGVLGVHQVFDNASRDPDRPWTKRAANRLRAWGAPLGPLNDMCDTLPSGMTWYYATDLVGMGAVQIDPGWSWWPW